MVTDNQPTLFTSVQPASTLMMQPQSMYYVVQPQPQPSTVLVAKSPGMAQNMYMMNNGLVAEGCSPGWQHSDEYRDPRPENGVCGQ